MWSYKAGLSDDGNYPRWNCPCAHVPGPDPPPFVGDHYYCESGDTGRYRCSEYYSSDVLWDGNQCDGSNNNCCTNSDIPWYFRQLARSVEGSDLEVRICHSENGTQEDTILERL